MTHIQAYFRTENQAERTRLNLLKADIVDVRIEEITNDTEYLFPAVVTPNISSQMTGAVYPINLWGNEIMRDDNEFTAVMTLESDEKKYDAVVDMIKQNGGYVYGKHHE
ncbi:MAG: hypothetical protein A2189_05810 [Paenibacillus sp. RIFOXYA1_FULL_44_5]|nr:MAG: hypothetical protein A2189_05810 [Paenibacillus sp. RIFOXYA1_FULL_44_5]